MGISSLFFGALLLCVAFSGAHPAITVEDAVGRKLADAPSTTGTTTPSSTTPKPKKVKPPPQVQGTACEGCPCVHMTNTTMDMRVLKAKECDS